MIPFMFTTNGPLVAGQDLDAPIYPGIRGEITQIAAYCKSGGEGDPLVFDVRKNGASLFAQAVKRPRLLTGGAHRIDLTPRQDLADRQLSMISTLSVHVMQAPVIVRAEDARVIVWFEPTTERGMPFCFSVNGMLANGLLDAPIFPGMSGTIDRISVCAKASAALSVPIVVQVMKNGQPICESIDMTLTGNYDTAEVMLYQPLTRNDLLSCILTGVPEATRAELSVMVWVI